MADKTVCLITPPNVRRLFCCVTATTSITSRNRSQREHTKPVKYDKAIRISAYISLIGSTPLIRFYKLLRGDNDAMKIELDIFSGRENPTWNLSPKEADVFVEKFKSLPKMRSEPPLRWNGLGYRGIVVRNGLNDEEGISELKVYDEVVHVISHKGPTNYMDRGRALELWLLETGKNYIGDQLYESVLAEIVK